MKIVFNTTDGTLTWEMPRDDVQAMKRLGINPRRQVESLKKVMAPTAATFTTLIHIANLGASGSPEEFTALLNEIDSSTRRLIASYVRFIDNA